MRSDDPEHMVLKDPRIYIGCVTSGPYAGRWELYLVGYTADADGMRWMYPSLAMALDALHVLTTTPDNPLSNWLARETPMGP